MPRRSEKKKKKTSIVNRLLGPVWLVLWNKEETGNVAWDVLFSGYPLSLTYNSLLPTCRSRQIIAPYTQYLSGDSHDPSWPPLYLTWHILIESIKKISVINLIRRPKKARNGGIYLSEVITRRGTLSVTNVSWIWKFLTKSGSSLSMWLSSGWSLMRMRFFCCFQTKISTTSVETVTHVFNCLSQLFLFSF